MTNPEYIVSGCLAGLSCRYDGGSRPCRQVVELCRLGKAAPICPEALSGLPAPRSPCEQRNGKVIMQGGKDVTDAFTKGADLALRYCIGTGARKAILKARSPSCGIGKIYNGTFTGALCAGNGIFAQKLLDADFELYDEENLPGDVASL